MGIKCPQCKGKDIERTNLTSPYMVISEGGKLRFEGPVDTKLEKPYPPNCVGIAQMMLLRCKKCGHSFPAVFPARR